MAAPSAPASCTVKRGRTPGEAVVTCATSVGATSYTAYLYPKSGVGTGTYVAKKHSSVPIFKFQRKSAQWKQVYAVCTATNVGGEESTASPAAHHAPAFVNGG